MAAKSYDEQLDQLADDLLKFHERLERARSNYDYHAKQKKDALERREVIRGWKALYRHEAYSQDLADISAEVAFANAKMTEMTKAMTLLQNAIDQNNKDAETLRQRIASKNEATSELLRKKEQDEADKRLKKNEGLIVEKALAIISKEISRRITRHDVNIKTIFVWGAFDWTAILQEGAHCDITVCLKSRPGEYKLRANQELELQYLGYGRGIFDKRYA